jgi:hypothetical protein
MHTNYLVVEPTLSLRNLVSMLDVQPYAAVMDGGQFHGLITRADVLNYLRRRSGRRSSTTRGRSISSMGAPGSSSA